MKVLRPRQQHRNGWGCFDIALLDEDESDVLQILVVTESSLSRNEENGRRQRQLKSNEA